MNGINIYDSLIKECTQVSEDKAVDNIPTKCFNGDNFSYHKKNPKTLQIPDKLNFGFFKNSSFPEEKINILKDEILRKFQFEDTSTQGQT